MSNGYRGWGIGVGSGRPNYYFDFVYSPPVVNYYNPYSIDPYFFPVEPQFDYSQPLLGDTNPSDQGIEGLALADEAFQAGDYTVALAEANKAAKAMPQNTEAHQFRSLVLFAMIDYQESAAAAHAALSGGPGWNWGTIRSFYPSKEAYTIQLRALEDYTTANLNDASARFLLGYHYMMLDHSEAAAKELVAVLELEPKNLLVSELLAGISKKTGNKYTPRVLIQPPSPQRLPLKAPKPASIKAATFNFIGNWKATQADGTIVSIKFLKDSKFEWSAKNKDRATKIEGTFAVENGQLKLTSKTPGKLLEGGVSIEGDSKFQWKLRWQNSGEPGLKFQRK